MSYISLSDQDKKEMLAKLGIGSPADLFSCIPEGIRLKRDLDLPAPSSELEVARHFESLGRENAYDRYLSFLGGGAYDHYIPAAVDYLSSRGEFVTPYTPYQPEVSQGTLQIIFEFQTLICQLTGLDVSNASLYEGASAAAETVLMARRATGKNKVLLASSVHPQYRHVTRTYVKNLGVHIEEIAWDEAGKIDLDDLSSKIDDGTAAVVLQSPNFFGVCENIGEIAGIAGAHKALCAVVVGEAVSLGLLEAPGKLGADIVAGEAQSFGLPPSYGGPYLGFMACRKQYVRQLPGRIAGQTRDVDGNRGFVLTLATREQHIRREKATSNICTNQALCAVRATIFLESLGGEGLREMARQNIQKSAYARDRIARLPGVRKKFSGPAFNEFVCEFPKPWKDINRILQGKGILGGISLEPHYPALRDCALICVTEKHTKDDIDRLAQAMKEALQ